MKKTFILFLVVFFFTTENFGQNWIPFNSSDGRFSVLLPSQPKMQSDTSKIYPKYITKMFMAKDKNDLFLVGWVDYESSFTFNAQKELEANRDNFIRSLRGTLVASKNVDFNGYQGLEFSATTATHFWTSKVFIVGRRPYQMLAGSSTGKASQNQIKFFNSFSLKNK